MFCIVICLLTRNSRRSIFYGSAAACVHPSITSFANTDFCEESTEILKLPCLINIDIFDRFFGWAFCVWLALAFFVDVWCLVSHNKIIKDHIAPNS
jgi:hypothetical protein